MYSTHATWSLNYAHCGKGKQHVSIQMKLLMSAIIFLQQSDLLVGPAVRKRLICYSWKNTRISFPDASAAAKLPNYTNGRPSLCSQRPYWRLETCGRRKSKEKCTWQRHTQQFYWCLCWKKASITPQKGFLDWTQLLFVCLKCCRRRWFRGMLGGLNEVQNVTNTAGEG